MPWGSQWGSAGATQAGSLKIAAGSPGIDTIAAGALFLAATNATSLNFLNGSYTLATGGAGMVLNFGDLSLPRHLLSTAAGTPATSALGVNVTSVTFTGNDMRGTIAIVMAGALAANTKVCTATFAVSYGAIAPKVTLVDQTSAVGLTIVNSYVLAQSTGVSFDIAFDQALAAGTYTIDYIVIG